MIQVPSDLPSRLVVAGIDTDAGKTVVSALLCLGLEADYWKPVQAGTVPTTDTETVQALTELPDHRFHPETYRLELPASPHFAAAEEGVYIDPAAFKVPETPRRLIIEGAGGLMVPLNPTYMYVDLLAEWKLPVVLVARTYLGSINHSLLSIEALKRRDIPVAGLIFNEGGRPESEAVIAEYGDVPVWGHVPQLKEVNRASLMRVWKSW
ncbi:MAG: dethiobiotin synthase, partial [Bacteroidota bacterium]